MHGASTFTDAALDVFDGWHLTFHVLHHQIIIHLDRSFDELLVICLYVIDHVCRHVNNFIVFWLTGIIPDVSFLGENVNNTNEIVLTANRQRHNKRVCCQNITHLVNYAVKIRTQTV